MNSSIGTQNIGHRDVKQICFEDSQLDPEEVLFSTFKHCKSDLDRYKLGESGGCMNVFQKEEIGRDKICTINHLNFSKNVKEFQNEYLMAQIQARKVMSLHRDSFDRSRVAESLDMMNQKCGYDSDDIDSPGEKQVADIDSDKVISTSLAKATKYLNGPDARNVSTEAEDTLLPCSIMFEGSMKNVSVISLVDELNLLPMKTYENFDSVEQCSLECKSEGECLEQPLESTAQDKKYFLQPKGTMLSELSLQFFEERNSFLHSLYDEPFEGSNPLLQFTEEVETLPQLLEDEDVFPQPPQKMGTLLQLAEAKESFPPASENMELCPLFEETLAIPQLKVEVKPSLQPWDEIELFPQSQEKLKLFQQPQEGVESFPQPQYIKTSLLCQKTEAALQLTKVDPFQQFSEELVISPVLAKKEMVSSSHPLKEREPLPQSLVEEQPSPQLSGKAEAMSLSLRNMGSVSHSLWEMVHLLTPVESKPLSRLPKGIGLQQSFAICPWSIHRTPWPLSRYLYKPFFKRLAQTGMSNQNPVIGTEHGGSLRQGKLPTGEQSRHMQAYSEPWKLNE